MYAKTTMQITDDDLKEMGKNLSDGKFVTPEFQKGINTLVAYMAVLAQLAAKTSATCKPRRLSGSKQG